MEGSRWGRRGSVGESMGRGRVTNEGRGRWVRGVMWRWNGGRFVGVMSGVEELRGLGLGRIGKAVGLADFSGRGKVTKEEGFWGRYV